SSHDHRTSPQPCCPMTRAAINLAGRRGFLLGRTMPATFNLQGHRGARGLKPENTLPSFEAAIDLGGTSIETDVRLSRDDVPVLCHDAAVSGHLFRLTSGSGSPDPATRPLVRALPLAQLRGYRGDRNPDPQRFPHQDAVVTPLARLFGEHMEID